MFGHRFYHKLIKKYTLLFANYFNDIQVVRKDANEDTVQSIAVPIAYSPIQKIMALKAREKNPGEVDNDYYAIITPRMGFEITGISYDSTKQLQPTILNRNIIKDESRFVNKQYIQIPYIMNFALYLTAKNTEELHQMVEQIVPFFTPEITATTNLIPDMNIKFDIPLKLTGIDLSDDYDSDIKERRLLNWTLNFEMKVYFFGPVTKQGVIKKVIVDFHTVKSNIGKVTGDDIENTPRIARIETTPGLTSDGKPTTNINNSIPYMQINEDDDYGFVEEYMEFDDGRRRNPVTGTDEPIK